MCLLRAMRIFYNRIESMYNKEYFHPKNYIQGDIAKIYRTFVIRFAYASLLVIHSFFFFLFDYRSSNLFSGYNIRYPLIMSCNDPFFSSLALG